MIMTLKMIMSIFKQKIKPKTNPKILKIKKQKLNSHYYKILQNSKTRNKFHNFSFIK